MGWLIPRHVDPAIVAWVDCTDRLLLPAKDGSLTVITRPRRSGKKDPRRA